MQSTHELIDEFINKRVWAVVGVSTNPRKFGNIIFRDMRRAGYEVYGVHPDAQPVDGETIYPSLADLPVRPEVIDVVIPPAATEQLVQQVKELGLDYVWIQPGAESPAAVAYCRENGIKVIAGGPCAMDYKRRWS